MNLAVKSTSPITAPKLTYDVLIENQQDGTVKAILLGLPDCQGLGNTETEAIEKLSQSLQTRLETAKIVTLEIEAPKVENPWMKFAGMHKDNPLFAEVLEYIEAERSQVDLDNETK
ncbi:type II toxin-antitoxin system HicB family antitoxin [Nostoc sp.]|uniref:type II toxin-antitoxin system HicB family antitoxin n=1 Tax=Nostoc sp. TaxID=1180 RepID=UPI002FF70B5E